MTIGSSCANAARGFGMLQEFVGERDLVVVGDDAAIEAKVAIIALHFGRDADGGLIHPASQRNEGPLPDFDRCPSPSWNKSASAENQSRCDSLLSQACSCAFELPTVSLLFAAQAPCR